MQEGSLDYADIQTAAQVAGKTAMAASHFQTTFFAMNKDPDR